MQHRAELLFELHCCSFCIACDVYNLSGPESSYSRIAVFIFIHKISLILNIVDGGCLMFHKFGNVVK